MSAVPQNTGQLTDQGLADVLDHVAVVSSFPGRLFTTYESMGFTLSPVARHSGSVRPGAPTEPWGIGNRCAMFADGGYLELLAVFDNNLFCRGFPERLANYEGLHIVAFECADATHAGEKLRDAGIEVQGIGCLERPVDTPEGTKLAQFSLVRVDPALIPECHFNILQHRTPEHLWQPSLVDHANGARRLLSISVCSAEPPATSARFQSMLDAVPEKIDGIHRLSMRRGHVDFVTPDQLPEIGFVSPPPYLPFVASLSVLTPDLSQVERVLGANNLTYEKHGTAISLAPESAMGALVVFKESFT